MSAGLSCGEKYRMRYIERIRIPPALNLVRGRVIHKANETNLLQKISSEKDLPLSDLKDCTRDNFFRSVENGVFLDKEEISAKNRLLNDTLNVSLKLITSYKDDIAPEITNVVEVERPFTVYLDDLDVTIRGKPDSKTKAGIRDLKVTKVSMSDDQIHNSELQPAFYGLADSIETGKKETIFTFDNLVATKIPKSQHHIIKVGPWHHLIIKKKIAAFIKMINAGVFLPPSIYPGWVCTPKYCGYHGICTYTK